MELSKQVCTREQGIRLAELGIDPTKSHFVWCGNEKNGYEVRQLIDVEDDGEGNVWFSAPAYTVAELSDILPHMLKSNDDINLILQLGFPWIESEDYNAGYIELFSDYSTGANVHFESAPTLAQAAAKLLLHLLENNFITPNP